MVIFDHQMKADNTTTLIKNATRVDECVTIWSDVGVEKCFCIWNFPSNQGHELCHADITKMSPTTKSCNQGIFVISNINQAYSVINEC